MAAIPALTATEVSQRVAAGDALTIVDVREGFELDIVRLPDVMHVSMAEIPGHLDSLPRDRDLVVLCHHGVRSAHVCGYLQQQGFSNVWNLTGGIYAWALEVDTTLPRY